MTSPHRFAYLLCLLLLVGCGAGGPTPSDTSSASPASSGPPSASSPTATMTWASIADRCYVDLPGRFTTFTGPDGSTLSGVVLGAGPTTAVFVHQLGAGGLCGWMPYATWATHHGIRAILIDVCGYGASRCTDRLYGDPVAMLRIPIDWAREHGAGRVTAVGASMGGSIVAGAAQRAGADAIVDLSGPSSWPNVPGIEEAAASITVPLLVAAYDGDRGIHPHLLERAVRGSPAHPKQYVHGPQGHGWGMVMDGITADARVTPLGRRVLAWIKQ